MKEIFQRIGPVERAIKGFGDGGGKQDKIDPDTSRLLDDIAEQIAIDSINNGETEEQAAGRAVVEGITVKLGLGAEEKSRKKR
jgi:hypothetical protein